MAERFELDEWDVMAALRLFYVSDLCPGTLRYELDCWRTGEGLGDNGVQEPETVKQLLLRFLERMTVAGEPIRITPRLLNELLDLLSVDLHVPH